MKYNIALPLLIAMVLLCSCSLNILSILNKTENLKHEIYSVYQAPSSNCEEAITTYQRLHELKQKYYFEVLSDFDKSDTVGLGEVAEINEEDKLLQAIEIDSACIEAYKLMGDIRAISLAKSDSLKDEALRWYSQGLRFDSTNAELNLRIAYVYDIFDSVALAREYYDMIDLNSVELKTIPGYEKKIINLKNILHKIASADSLVHFFDQGGDNSYVLLKREPTYTFGTPPATYCRIWANGKMEYHDYFGDSESPFHYETTLPDSQISSLLDALVQIRFFSLYNPFKPDYPIAADFEYVKQLHLPNYYIEFHTPSLSHEVSVYGLGAIYGENALQDVPSVTYDFSGNIPPNSRISKKLGKLSEFWSQAFSSKVISTRISEVYGEYFQPVYGPQNYIYAKDEAAFLKITLPSFKYEWKTLRSTETRAKAEKYNHVYFLIDGILYALDRDDGGIISANKTNVEEYPYFNIYREKYYTGRIEKSVATLIEYDSQSGVQKRQYQSSNSEDGYDILLGEKLNEHEKQRVAFEFRSLRNFYIKISSE